jgi:hypothetical protein
MSTIYYKKYGPLAILWIFMILLSINYFTGGFQNFTDIANTWTTIVGLFTAFVATGFFLIRSVGSLSRMYREKKIGEEFILQTWTLILFFSIIIISLVSGIDSDAFEFINTWMYVPCVAVEYGFCPIYIGAAVYRTWRAKSFDSLLLVVGFILVMIRGAPIFGTIPWSQEPGIWLATTLTKGPFRVLQIGASIGILLIIINGLRGRQAGLD